MQFGLRTLLFVVLLLGMLVLSYPLLFKPLNEQVLVYNAPFRLVAQLGLDPTRPLVTPLQKGARLTLDASVDYQACDDRVCYLPESIPLRWTVTLAPTPRP